MLAKLIVPKSAKRTATPLGRKCRAEFVKVVEISDMAGNKFETGHAQHDGTKYEVGQKVHPDHYDDTWLEECTHGIHFFCTREEAEEWL